MNCAPEHRFITRVLRTFLLGAVGLWLAAALTGCEETLPPLPVEQTMQEASVAFITAEHGLVYLSPVGIPLGSGGTLVVSVRNLYNDVLSDVEDIQVEATVVPEGHPEATVVLTAGSAEVPDVSMFVGPLVATPPRQTLRIEKWWPHSTANGKPLGAQFGTPVTVVRDNGRPIGAMQVTLAVDVRVRVFKTRASMQCKREFVLNYATP